MAINKVIIKGNISNEVELKQTQSGTSVCSFNVAVNRFSKDSGEAKVDFLTVVAWQQKAEFVAKYFGKGKPIIVVGRLENREWTDKQGNKRISTEIIAEEIDFVGGKETETEKQAAKTPYVPIAYTQNSQNFEEIASNDEDLPF
jgi:single-strand DNA-binding protein